MKLKKTVFITGACGGIGIAVKNKFKEEGYNVIATDILLKSDGMENDVFYYKMDVSDRDAVVQVIDKVVSQVGDIDVLVCVAGVFDLISIDNISSVDWERIFSINTLGVVNVTQIIAKKMKKNKRGNIVVVSSNAAKFPRKYMSIYASSKAATTMYTKCIGLELAEFGIRCNIVSPGSTNTTMQRKLWNSSDKAPDSILKGSLGDYRLGIPLGKIAEPEEVAEVIYYLASDKASHITLEDVTIDGGATMGV